MDIPSPATPVLPAPSFLSTQRGKLIAAGAAFVVLLLLVLAVVYLIRAIVGVSVPDGFLVIEHGNKRSLIRADKINVITYTEGENKIVINESTTLISERKAEKLASELGGILNKGQGKITVTEVK